MNALFIKNEEKELEKENNFSESDPFGPLNTKKRINSKKQTKYPIVIEEEELTVQYLSPLVLRKELENIILNENQDNEEFCFFDENFMLNHKIIFWNMIWYYKRIGVDSSYLENILLNSRIKLKANKDNISLEGNYFDYKNIFSEISFSEYNTHPYVRIYCMWDNLSLHNQKNFEIPLYISWLRENHNTFINESNFRLVTVLNWDDLINAKQSGISENGLSKNFDLILRNVKENEIIVPFNNLVRDRFIANRNFHSIYREILFLIIVALDRDLIDIGMKKLKSSNFHKFLI